MNKNILKISTLVAFWAFCSQNATAQQGFGTNKPSKASSIEMKSVSKGLLIPRVALTGLNNFDPIKGELGTDAAKVNSLLVYNTATTTGITPGYYYWTTDGTTPNSYWKRLLAGDDAAALNLLGDVTGTLGATTVVKIQGRDVANNAPTSNQVLTWNGTAWTPTSLTPAQITDAQNVTAGSNKVTLGGTPQGAALKAFSVDVVEANLTLSNMGGKVTNNQITPGSTGQVLVTDGTTTSWQNPVDNNTTYTGSASVHLDGTSFQREALTGDVTADRNSNVTTIANNAVTTDKIADANVTAAKLTAGTGAANRVAIADATGAVTYTDALPSSSVDGEDVTAGSNKVTLGGTPQGAALKAFSVDVAEANLTLSNMGGKVTNNQITTGNAGQVLVTSTDGTTTTWIDQSVIAPTTTNALSSAANSMTSNVNGVSRSTDIINSNGLSVTGTELTSTVNGVPATVDLASVVQAAQKTTTVTAGTNTAVTPAAPNATGNTEYVVNVATGNGTTLGVVKEAATNPSVAVASDGSLSVNIANITDRGSLSASTGDNSITVNNGTNATFVNTDIKVTDGGISTAKIANNAVTVQKLPAGATNTTFLRGDGAWVTPTDNNTTYSGSASVILDGTSFQRAALTGDVTAPQNSNVTTIANNAVTTPKIADDAVTAAKVNADVAGNGLTQAANGALQVNVNNGISIADDLVQLGGALIKPTTITATATNTLAVAGLQPTTDAAKTTDAFVVVGDNGVLKKADIKYSTTEQVTGKKWIGGQVVYERVLEVTLNVEANTITLPTGSRPAKIIGMRMISRTGNSITTELSRYDATTGVMVFGSGPTTQFQKVGTYDLILEYIK